MPFVLQIGPYRFYFWSRENREPPHIHVRRERSEAKFWLEPVIELADQHGFPRHELNVVRKLVELHRERLLEAWHDHFGEI